MSQHTQPAATSTPAASTADVGRFSKPSEPTPQATSNADGLKNRPTEEGKSPERDATGRDAKGRFAAGNKGGPGNPFARRVAAIRSLLFQIVSDEDLIDMIKATIEESKKGNIHATKFIFSYLLGKPLPGLDPDRIDSHEWQGFHETATMIRDVPFLIQAPSPELPLDMVRGAKPGVTKGIAQKLYAMMTAPPEPEEPEEEENEEETPEQRAAFEEMKKGAIAAGTWFEDPLAPNARPNGWKAQQKPDRPKPNGKKKRAGRDDLRRAGPSRSEVPTMPSPQAEAAWEAILAAHPSTNGKFHRS